MNLSASQIVNDSPTKKAKSEAYGENKFNALVRDPQNALYDDAPASVEGDGVVNLLGEPMDEESDSEEATVEVNWVNALQVYPLDQQVSLCRAYASFLVKQMKAESGLHRANAMIGTDLMNKINE